MPGEGHEVRVPRLDVGGEVGDALRAVDQGQGPDAVGPADQLPDGGNGAQDVGHGREGEETGPFVEEPVHRVHVQMSVGGDGDPAQAGPRARGNELPGHKVGVVLHLGDQDFVLRGEVTQAPGIGDEVDGLGGVAHEHDFPVGAGVDEAGDVPPRVLVHLGGPLAELVDAPVDVGVRVFVHGGHGVDDLPGFLGRGRAVQVDQRFPPRALPEYGKVLPNPPWVQALCR